VDAPTHLATLREWKKAGRVRYPRRDGTITPERTPIWKRLSSPETFRFRPGELLACRAEADRRLLAAAADSRTAVIATGHSRRGDVPPRARRAFARVGPRDRLRELAQFFLKWILGHLVTCAIPGTRTSQHVADNLGAASGPLPDEAMRRRMSVYFESL